MADSPSPTRLYHINHQPRSLFGFARPITIRHIHQMICEFKKLREGLRVRTAVLHAEGVQEMPNEEAIERAASSANRDRKVAYKDSTSPVIYRGSRIEIEDESGQLAVEVRIRDKDSQFGGILESALGWLSVVVCLVGVIVTGLRGLPPVILGFAALCLIVDGRRRMVNKLDPRIQVNVSGDETTRAKVNKLIKTITR